MIFEAMETQNLFYKRSQLYLLVYHSNTRHNIYIHKNIKIMCMYKCMDTYMIYIILGFQIFRRLILHTMINTKIIHFIK